MEITLNVPAPGQVVTVTRLIALRLHELLQDVGRPLDRGKSLGVLVRLVLEQGDLGEVFAEVLLELGHRRMGFRERRSKLERTIE